MTKPITDARDPGGRYAIRRNNVLLPGRFHTHDAASLCAEAAFRHDGASISIERVEG